VEGGGLCGVSVGVSCGGGGTAFVCCWDRGEGGRDEGWDGGGAVEYKWERSGRGPNNALRCTD